VDNYWIRARPSSGNRGLPLTFSNGVNSAILRYDGAKIQDPTSTQPLLPSPLVESSLHPNPPISVPGDPHPDGADQIFNLVFGIDPSTGDFTINGVAYKSPTVPVLLQILSGTKNAQNLLPRGSVYTVQRNQTIQINMPSGFIGGPHPFHLHGVSGLALARGTMRLMQYPCNYSTTSMSFEALIPGSTTSITPL